MQNTFTKTVSSFYTSSSQFGAFYENNFVLSEDGRHLIGVDGTDCTRLLVEDLETGAGFHFGKHADTVYTLVFDPDSGTLLAGDLKGRLIQYRLDLQDNQAEQTKDHGNLGIGLIYSSAKLKGLVFFGGNQHAFRVLDLSTGEMVPGQMRFCVQEIRSLQVCVLEKSRIFLAAVGRVYSYSSTRSDLYDLGDLISGLSIPGEMAEDRKEVTVPSLEREFKKLQEMQSRTLIESVALLVENNKLILENLQLKQEINSNEETISVLLETHNELKKKISAGKTNFQELLAQKQEIIDKCKSLKSRFKNFKAKSKAKVMQLNKKLLILNRARNTKTAFPEGTLTKKWTNYVLQTGSGISKTNSPSKPKNAKTSKMSSKTLSGRKPSTNRPSKQRPKE